MLHTREEPSDHMYWVCFLVAACWIQNFTRKPEFYEMPLFVISVSLWPLVFNTEKKSTLVKPSVKRRYWISANLMASNCWRWSRSSSDYGGQLNQTPSVNLISDSRLHRYTPAIFIIVEWLHHKWWNTRLWPLIGLSHHCFKSVVGCSLSDLQQTGSTYDFVDNWTV